MNALILHSRTEDAEASFLFLLFLSLLFSFFLGDTQSSARAPRCVQNAA